MLCVGDVIQIAHQCTMQEREKQPASNAGKKEERRKVRMDTRRIDAKITSKF